MNDMPPAARSGFDGPATYRIGVKGRIPPKWRDCLEGMAITEWSAEGMPPRTTFWASLPIRPRWPACSTRLFVCI